MRSGCAWAGLFVFCFVEFGLCLSANLPLGVDGRACLVFDLLGLVFIWLTVYLGVVERACSFSFLGLCLGLPANLPLGVDGRACLVFALLSLALIWLPMYLSGWMSGLVDFIFLGFAFVCLPIYLLGWRGGLVWFLIC